MNTNIQKGSGMATSVRLPLEIKQRLDALASHTGRTTAFLLRQIIEQGIEDVEDYYAAADALERVRKGETTVHSEAEVRRALGLDERWRVNMKACVVGLA